MHDSDVEVVFQTVAGAIPKITVVIPTYEREAQAVQALDSVVGQTLQAHDLVVVDDASKDGTLQRVRSWMQSHHDRFGQVTLLHRTRNGGTSAARNDAVRLARGPFFLPLDHDNVLLPRCGERCLEALEASGAAAAYPILATFGGGQELMGTNAWSPDLLAYGNYIDTLAVVAVEAWKAVGGYKLLGPFGLEDYELWCDFVDHGFEAIQVPEILALYRRSAGSRSDLQRSELTKIQQARAEAKLRHPWLR